MGSAGLLEKKEEYRGGRGGKTRRTRREREGGKKRFSFPPVLLSSLRALRVFSPRPPRYFLLFFRSRELHFSRPPGFDLELEQDGVGPAGTLQLGVTQTLAEAGIGFWLSDHVQVYGGARYQDVDNEIGLGTGASSIGDSWVDGMLGLQLAPVASDHWLLWIRGDAGTGGSDLTWLFEAGAAYSWDDPYAIYCAYRMLDTDFQNDNFEYDMRQSGFLFGFGFRF